MAQHDYVIANGTGAAVRSDLNNALAAIVSQNSGATAPATTYAYQFWADTTTGTLKLRNSANSAWIELLQLDGTLTMEDGTEALPGLSFRSDLDTGLWRPGTNQLAISTNAVERVEFGASEVVFNDGGANYDFRVEGDTNANLLFVDASADTVGIGSSSPTAKLVCDGTVQITNQTAPSSGAGVEIAYTSDPLGFVQAYDRSAAAWRPLQLKGSTVQLQTGGTAALHVDASQRVGIGTASPGTRLEVSGADGEFIRINTTTSAGGYMAFRTNTVNMGFIGAGDQLGGGTATDLNVRSQNSLTFCTNGGNERARIDSSGRLLVGTSSTSSSAIAIVQGNATVSSPGRLFLTRRNTASNADDELGVLQFADSGHTSAAEIAAIRDGATWTSGSDQPTRLVFSTTADGASSPTGRVLIYSDGAVGISNSPYLFPTTDNARSLGLSGLRWSAVWAANGTIQTSDQRTKTDIANATLGSDFIKSLRPVSYKWIEGGKRDTGERDEDNNYIYESVPGERTHWGFIAQEVKEAIDAAGVDFGGWLLTDKNDPDSHQALRYDQFIAPLTKALQEALAEIDVLKAKVAALENA